MIIGVTGKPRHGKTLRLVWLIGQYAMAGRFIATNVALTESCPFSDRVFKLDDPNPWDDSEPMLWPVFNVIEHEYPGYYPCQWDRQGKPDRWYRAFWHFMPRGSVVAVSEATNYWDSLNFASMPEICRNYWTQHAKDGTTIILDFQNLENLYNRIRRMIETFIVCEHTARTHWAFRFVPVSWSAFVADSFSSEAMRMTDYLESGSLSWNEAQQMFGWYDTTQTYGGYANFKKEDIYAETHVYARIARERSAGRTEKGNGDSADATQAALVA